MFPEIHTNQSRSQPSPEATCLERTQKSGDEGGPLRADRSGEGQAAPTAAETPRAPRAHPLGAAVAVEEDGRRAPVHLVARVPPRVVHLQQPVLVRQPLREETWWGSGWSNRDPFAESPGQTRAGSRAPNKTPNTQGTKEVRLAHQHGVPVPCHDTAEPGVCRPGGDVQTNCRVDDTHRPSPAGLPRACRFRYVAPEGCPQ